MDTKLLRVKPNSITTDVKRASRSNYWTPIFRKLITLSISFSLCACVTITPLEPNEINYFQNKLIEPKMCLALSGGGVRSASVSVGALRELYAAGLLDDIDLISGASGGAWAMYWMYANANQESSMDTVFGSENGELTRPIKQLDETQFMDVIWRAWTATWSLLRLGSSAYYADLHGKFGPGPWVFRDLDINALSTTTVSMNLPVPLIIASASAGKCSATEGLSELDSNGLRNIPVPERIKEFAPLHKTIIEFTPMNWGNEYFGYSTQWPYSIQTMEDWAMLSGAIIDYPRNESCGLMNLLGLTWGQSVEVSKNTGFSKQFGNVFLADGGFADNLAAFPLFLRDCDLTIILDAEQDPLLEFEGYQILRAKLENSIDMSLRIPAIDQWLNKPFSATSDYLADDPTISLVKTPVYRGKIVDDQNSIGQEVIYLKLTYNPTIANEYGEAAQALYKLRYKDTCKDEASAPYCFFPHTPTFHTAYTVDEAKAHRELGESLTRLHLIPELKLLLKRTHTRY